MRRIEVNVSGLATLTAFVLAWEALVRVYGADVEFLPAPSAIIAEAPSLFASGDIAQETLHTFAAVIAGWAIAAGIGVILGLALGLSETFRTWTLASFEVLRPLPAIAFLPLALLLFNFSMRTELVIIVYASVWPTLVNTMRGVMLAPPQLRDVERSLRLSRMKAISAIILPAAAPAIVTGCRLSMGLSLVMAIIAEMLANPQGLGYALVMQLQAMQPARMFVYVVYIGLLAVCLNALLLIGADWLLRAHPRDREAHG